MTTESTETAIVPITEEVVNILSVDRIPEEVLTEARKAAVALADVIKNKKNPVKINGEVYLEAEDWMTVARFYGVTARIRLTNYLDYGGVRGFEATAEAYLVKTGQVISTAESMCLSDENRWAGRPLFMLRSMAQTRAASRVLRQVFGWVVVLAGYKTTPAEEMQEVQAEQTQQPSQRQMPQRKSNNGQSETKAEGKINEKQQKLVYAVAKGEMKFSDDDLKAELKLYGVEHTRDLTPKQMDELLKRWKSGGKEKPARDDSDFV